MFQNGEQSCVFSSMSLNWQVTITRFSCLSRFCMKVQHCIAFCDWNVAILNNRNIFGCAFNTLMTHWCFTKRAHFSNVKMSSLIHILWKRTQYLRSRGFINQYLYRLNNPIALWAISPTNKSSSCNHILHSICSPEHYTSDHLASLNREKPIHWIINEL